MTSCTRISTRSHAPCTASCPWMDWPANILAATARMQADTSPDSTNLMKFRREFEALYQDVDQQAVWDRIMEFYATTFDNVHDVVGRNEPLYRSVVYLRAKGHRVLLTTNPVFPQLATYKRLAWAGFSPDAFEYVSTMENCGYSKPHAEYWHHVADTMGVDPAQAIAVGNDCTEDMSAHLAGIETYLVTDYVIGDVDGVWSRPRLGRSGLRALGPGELLSPEPNRAAFSLR